ncbi:uncharacterized protein T551_01402 [Pneumocystis jirovecii RU7]|uniref:Uncharacterized protein n=1 Tax=Pneumocystis jirovecii (strain RU7) TaxID=1408657 RepID=A0A0W4ZSI8_PNEJ7|nr:uncharacterized protein T551_01402 [Pneumocystis jirovecii RU7]KTW31330.1 hypothetical protein T551_01402 [Pneumocystis jirovecii RU7]
MAQSGSHDWLLKYDFRACINSFVWYKKESLEVLIEYIDWVDESETSSINSVAGDLNFCVYMCITSYTQALHILLGAYGKMY